MNLLFYVLKREETQDAPVTHVAKKISKTKHFWYFRIYESFILAYGLKNTNFSLVFYLEGWKKQFDRNFLNKGNKSQLKFNSTVREPKWAYKFLAAWTLLRPSLFFLHLASNAFPDIGSVGLKKKKKPKKKKKLQEVSG